MRCIIGLLCIVGLVAPFAVRQRSEPNEWFSQLIIEDQAHDSHDHSGETVERKNHTCCHRMNFDGDPLTGEDLMHVQVPYNHWWKNGATLVTVADDLEEPSNRFVEIGDNGIMLDFRMRSRLFVRLQCGYPCCLEGAHLILPPGAQLLTVAAGNATGIPVRPWRYDPRNNLPPGYVIIGDPHGMDLQMQLLWTTNASDSRLETLTMCDHNALGMWIAIDSPSRIVAALLGIEVCFIHHDLSLDWETALCGED